MTYRADHIAGAAFVIFAIAVFAVPVWQAPLASTQPLQGLVTQAPLVQLWLEPQATQARFSATTIPLRNVFGFTVST